MTHFTSPDFWKNYKKLPEDIQRIADKNFKLLKKNPNHPSLFFKRVRKYYSIRIGLKYRALAVEMEEGLLWFWIGSHAEYDRGIG